MIEPRQKGASSMHGDTEDTDGICIFKKKTLVVVAWRCVSGFGTVLIL